MRALSRLAAAARPVAARSQQHAHRSSRGPLSARGYATARNPKPPVAGQPLSSTHPHLVPEGDLTPGITPEEYEDRRRRLMEGLEPGAVVVVMGGTVRLVSQQILWVHADYTDVKLQVPPGWVGVDSLTAATDFYYLTGFNEPEATAVLVSKPSSPRGYTYTLFVPPRSAHELLWQGEVCGVDGAVSTFGADEAYANHQLSQLLPGYLNSATTVYASLPPSPSPSPSSQPYMPGPRRRSSLLKLFSPPPSTSPFASNDPPHLMLAAALASNHAESLERKVQALRVRKSPAELKLMAAAADLSGRSHAKVMGFASPSGVGSTEAALAAHFEYHCALGGSERPAYVPVVASGANSLVIHYTRNDCVLDDGDLVLIDAGAEKSMYASDITRTFPVNGKFSDPQRDLYQAVLNAQKALVKRCRADERVSMNELHRQKLRNINFSLSTGDVERKLYPHFLSHHVGSDLHDCATADRSAVLSVGNVVTIEPGLYVPLDESFPKAFRGIGVRIEDEVAITEGEPWVLSASAPKEVEDVERACSM